MQYFYEMVISLCLFVGVAFAVETAGPITIDLQKSGKNWVKAKDESVSGQGIVEYVLANENVDNWSEVVTIQYFSGIKLPPKELFDLFIRDLKRDAGQDAIKSEVIVEHPDNLLAEWSLRGMGHNQYEWIRIMNDGTTTAIVRYQTKKSDELDSSRVVWEEILRDTHFTEPAKL